MNESDVVLLESWMRERNAEAFKTLAKRYAGMVYGTCKRILNNPAEAEDVSQECFEILATTQKPVGEYLAPWLHRVACNKSLTRLRAEHRRKEREAQFTAELDVGHEVAWNDLYGFVECFGNDANDAFEKLLGIDWVALAFQLAAKPKNLFDHIHATFGAGLHRIQQFQTFLILNLFAQ